MAYRTRPIVRPGVTNRMVTKGYRKGVYEWVTKGTTAGANAVLRNQSSFQGVTGSQARRTAPEFVLKGSAMNVMA